MSGDTKIPPQPNATFRIVLGPTHYARGIVNPGVQTSQYLGKHGDPIRIRFSDGSETIISRIDRLANRTGAVRVIGGNGRIARWFQHNFKEGDTVQGCVVDPHRIELCLG